mmetsp:Transcript_1297/g.3764  ORF Transcript_1297/g.3764 Transcript_1297/m.3764 type:complete len:88 (-) Transcript_1297:1051-1314(-)
MKGEERSRPEWIRSLSSALFAFFLQPPIPPVCGEGKSSAVTKLPEVYIESQSPREASVLCDYKNSYRLQSLLIPEPKQRVRPTMKAA